MQNFEAVKLAVQSSNSLHSANNATITSIATASKKDVDSAGKSRQVQNNDRGDMGQNSGIKDQHLITEGEDQIMGSKITGQGAELEVCESQVIATVASAAADLQNAHQRCRFAEILCRNSETLCKNAENVEIQCRVAEILCKMMNRCAKYAENAKILCRIGETL